MAVSFRSESSAPTAGVGNPGAASVTRTIAGAEPTSDDVAELHRAIALAGAPAG